jgi:RNA polymerase sigma-70 factor (ECF subfamily)
MENALKRLAVVPESDGALVERAAQGDERAFSQIYRRHARYLAGVVYRVMGDAAELDDVVQEVFLTCLRGLPSLKEGERLRPWLVTIAVRQTQKRLTARGRRRWLGVQVGLVAARVSDPQLSRDVADLYRGLDRLSPKLRVPWVLARLEGASLDEVAAWCEISVATAKRRLARADQFLKRRFDHG